MIFQVSSDWHFNFLSGGEQSILLSMVKHPLLFAGDLSTYDRLLEDMGQVDKGIKKPCFFVLGNHDFWGGSFNFVQQAVKNHVSTPQIKNLIYLTAQEVINQEEGVVIIGDDGWYDCRLYDPFNVHGGLNDWNYMGDFKGCTTKYHVVNRCREIADEATLRVGAKLESAIEKSAKKIILVTHVPPFKEMMSQKRYSNPEFSTFYCNIYMGDMLREKMKKHPDVVLTVVSGHTHTEYEGMVADNIRGVNTGSDYQKPSIKEIKI